MVVAVSASSVRPAAKSARSEPGISATEGRAHHGCSSTGAGGGIAARAEQWAFEVDDIWMSIDGDAVAVTDFGS
jgi:hypothetical protein